MEAFVPYAEIALGVGCLALAFFLFAPLKRFASQHGVKQASSIDVVDEMLIICWIIISIVGLSLIAYGLTN